MAEEVARNPKLSNLTENIAVDDEAEFTVVRKALNLDRRGRGICRVVHAGGAGLSIAGIAKVFRTTEEVVNRAITNERSAPDHDNPAHDKWLVGVDYRERYFPETIKQEEMEEGEEEDDQLAEEADEILNDDDNGGTEKRARLREAPRLRKYDNEDNDSSREKRTRVRRRPRLRVADGEHEHLPNPTARQFKDGLLNLRIKNYSGLNMVDRRGRALIRQVFPHIDNLSAIGRAYGIAHNPIKSIVYNELDPEDDLSEDNGLVGPDFLHHFPPAPCPPKGRRVSRHVGRPTKKKSTSSANGKGKEMAVASKRRTPMANSDEESSAEADNRSNSGRSHCSREIDDIAPWDSREAPLDNAERQQTSPTPSPLVHNSPRHGGVASPQQQTFPTPSPPVHNPPRHGGAASPQDAPVHNVYTSHADIESQALPRFSPKGRAIPPTLEAFLENVGNFNLTGWSGKLVDLGFHSMYELQRVAKLDEEHRVRTLEMLLLPAQMTQLLIVSLATTLGDMPMHNVYESGGSGSAPRADVESQALPRFSPKGRVIPPAMEAFLENVGNFNLTGWSGELVDLGFHSMYEVRRVAKLDDEHRVRTLEMLLLPAQMTQLLIVSLAMKFADVGAQ
ncbi:hypothetical protein C8R43DRAFT_1139393 [Mycena crocata]|nr:hypothetical protein C8R43DRAFT_1139393 [Mycena crocata]